MHGKPGRNVFVSEWVQGVLGLLSRDVPPLRDPTSLSTVLPPTSKTCEFPLTTRIWTKRTELFESMWLYCMILQLVLLENYKITKYPIETLSESNFTWQLVRNQDPQYSILQGRKLCQYLCLERDPAPAKPQVQPHMEQTWMLQAGPWRWTLIQSGQNLCP